MRYLLLILVGLEFRFKFRLVAYYASTKSNWLLGGIGRFGRFKNHTDAEVQSMIQTELIGAHVPGLVFQPLTALLDFFTKGGTVFKSFVLPDGSVDHIAARHELAVATEHSKWPVAHIAGQRSRGSPLSCVIWHNGEIGDFTTEGNAPWRTQDGALLLG